MSLVLRKKSHKSNLDVETELKKMKREKNKRGSKRQK